MVYCLIELAEGEESLICNIHEEESESVSQSQW